MDSDIGFGMVLFDDKNTHDTAWACRWEGDDTKVLRINGTGELSSDVVWMTNLSFSATLDSGLTGARFRRDDYLGRSLYRIWQEMGINGDELLADPSTIFGGKFTQPSHVRAAFSAWALKQVVHAADGVVPFPVPPLFDMTRGFQERLIPKYRSYFPKGLVPPDEVIDALDAADLTYQPIARTIIDRGNRPQGNNQESIRVFPDRLAHAVRMLSATWPIGGWRNLGDMRLLNSLSLDKIEEFLLAHPAALFKVTIRKTDRAMEPVINHGANINRKAKQGSWLTSGDAVRLLPWCDIKFHRGWEGELVSSGFQWLQYSDIPLDLETVEMRSGSWSFGMVMDILWRSIMKPPLDFRVTPAAAFMRSYDRTALFPAVTALVEHGINVAGYGGGGITINIDERVNRLSLNKVLMECGLTPVFMEPGVIPNADALEFSKMCDPNLPEPDHHLRSLILSGDLATIMEMDEVLSKWQP